MLSPTSCGTAADFGVGVAVGVLVGVNVGVGVGGTGVGDGVAVGTIGVGVGLGTTTSLNRLNKLGSLGERNINPATSTAASPSIRNAIAAGLHPPLPACTFTEPERIAIDVGDPSGLLTWRVAVPAPPLPPATAPAVP
jgi:hypothetical protein